MNRIMAAAAVSLAASAAFAQTPPDAGVLQREIGREAPRRPSAASLAVPAPMKPAAKGATVTVRAFVVEGATLVPAAELAAQLADLVGQSLTLADLERAAQRLAAHYRARGWLVRVYLPAQEVRDGVVRIAVVEGRLSGIAVENTGRRADAGRVERMVANGLATGEPIAAEALERGLLLANDLPGIQATGMLEAGDAVGETRLRLKIEDAPLAAGDLALANHGTRATGIAQLAAGLVVNPGNGDQWSLRGIASRDLDMVRAAYALPLGDDGLRLGVNASELRYRLGGEFAALDASGSARTAGATLSWPLRRAATDNLGITAGVENRRYADDSLGSALRRKKIDALTLAVSGDRIDGLGGGGFSQFGASLVSGRLDLSGVAADFATDQAGPRAHGGYAKLALNAAHLQRLPAEFTFSAALSAQLAAKNLDSSEKFALGGPSGVRAYPVNEAAGDAGWLLNLELRKDLGDGWHALALLDAGEVQQHASVWSGWQAGASAPNRYGLAGAGFGLGWNKPGDIALQLTLSAPLGNNPGQTAAGRNQDGSARGPRGWLRVVKYF